MNPERYLSGLSNTSPHVHDVEDDEISGVDPKENFLEHLKYFLGNLHPIAVHFPIVLIFLSTFAGILGLIRTNSFFDQLSKLCLYLSLPVVAVTFGLGLFAADNPGLDTSLHDLLNFHRISGIVLLVMVFATGFACLLSEKKVLNDWFYKVGLGICLLTVLFSGYTGGEMVFGPGHFLW